jgi:hypothetical protein
MRTEFVTARFPDASMPKTQTKNGALRRVHDFVRMGERARIREAGGDFGPWRREIDAVERLETRMARMGVGPKLIVQREKDKAQLSIREVSAGPLIPDLGANPHIEKSHALTYARFDDLRSGGVWLCRNVDGTTTVSKHGYLDDVPPEVWRGAAEDTFVTAGGMDHLEDVARFKVSLARKGELTLATVIVNRTIYTAPAFDPRPYGGVQHFHIHEDAPGGHACKP